MRKRSIAIKGHRTSVSLEAAFWDALDAIALEECVTLPALISEIDRRRLEQSPAPGLASALRVYALKRVKELAARSSGVRDET